MPNGCQMYSLSGSKTKRTSVADRAPAKIRMQPNVGTLLAACRANKPGLLLAQTGVGRSHPAKSQNDARFTSSRQGFGWGCALPVIVQPVFEFHHPLLKTIKVLPDDHGSRLSSIC